MVRIAKSRLSSLRNASVTTIHKTASDIIEQVSQESGVFDAAASNKVPCFDLDGKREALLSIRNFTALHDLGLD